MAQLWRKERSKPHTDLTIEAHMEEKTEVFKRMDGEAKDRQWKSFCDTLKRENTHFWQFTDRCRVALRTPKTPDLIVTSGAILKNSKEKGSTLLQRFVQQSN